MANVFLSYSLSKSAHRPAAEKLVRILSETLGAAKLTVVDPMASPGFDGIRDKVETALRSADACFADCSAGAPNVMFEVGYCRSRGCPVIILVDEDADDVPELREHLRFIGISSERPLPGDIGDVEYLPYPSDPKDPEGWTDFNGRLVAVLARLKMSLSVESVLLKRQTDRIVVETLKYIERQGGHHPLLRFLAGWHSRLADAFSTTGDREFQVPASAYPSCLRAFDESDRLTMRAVADLSDEAESFWEKDWNVKDSAVQERIFLVDWRDFFDESRLRRLFDIGHDHSQLYAVRFGHIDPSWRDMHPLASKAVGHHMFLMPPDIVGGYFDAGHRGWQLHVERGGNRYQRGCRLYEAIVPRTVAFKREWTNPSEMKRAWMQQHSIGIWKPDWNLGRTESYCRNYDLHIRCWIPRYGSLIKACGNLAIAKLSSMAAAGKRGIRLLEIGYGTAAVSESVIKWMTKANALLDNPDHTGVFASYVGIDREERMQKIACARTQELPFVRFDVASFPGGFYPAKARFDAILASLVVHDLLAPAQGPRPEDAMAKLAERLRPEGSLVLADCFPAEEPKDRAEQIAYWRADVGRTGLLESEIDAFLDANDEMLAMPSVEAVRTMAETAGLKMIDCLEVDGRLSPFRVLHFAKMD